MPVTFGQTTIGSDVSFANKPLQQMSVGPVIVWELLGQGRPNTLSLKMNPPTGQTITLPISRYNNGNYTVNWGDGTVNNNTNSHVYGSSLAYFTGWITMTGEIEWNGSFTNDNLTEISVTQYCPIRKFVIQKDFNWNIRAFYNNKNLTKVDGPLFSGLRGVNSKSELILDRAFYNCSNLHQVNWNNFFYNLPKDITTLFCQEMFYGCNGLSPYETAFADFPTSIQELSLVGFVANNDHCSNVKLSSIFNFKPLSSLKKLHLYRFYQNSSHYGPLENDDGFLANLPTSIEILELSLMFAGTEHNSIHLTDKLFSGVENFSNLKTLDLSQMFSGRTLTPITDNAQVIPSNLFAKVPNKKWVWLQQTFENCKINQSINIDARNKNAPNLWNTHGSTEHKKCFSNFTQLNNYSSINSGWK